MLRALRDGGVHVCTGAPRKGAAVGHHLLFSIVKSVLNLQKSLFSPPNLLFVMLWYGVGTLCFFFWQLTLPVKLIIKGTSEPNCWPQLPLPLTHLLDCVHLAPDQKCYSPAETLQHLFITYGADKCLQFSSYRCTNEHLLVFLASSRTWAGGRLGTEFLCVPE